MGNRDMPRPPIMLMIAQPSNFRHPALMEPNADFSHRLAPPFHAGKDQRPFPSVAGPAVEPKFSSLLYIC